MVSMSSLNRLTLHIHVRVRKMEQIVEAIQSINFSSIQIISFFLRKCQNKDLEKRRRKSTEIDELIEVIRLSFFHASFT